MKTLTQFENSKKASFEEEQIDEGLFGKIFGALFKKNAKLFDAVGSALGEEKGKRLKKFEEELFKKDEKAAEKAVKDDDAKKAIEFIENGVEELKKAGIVKEEDEWTFKAIQAVAMNAQHAGDENYKKAMQEYIDKCKQKGGGTTKKELQSVAEKIKKDGNENQENQETAQAAPTDKDKVVDKESTEKASKTLGGDSDKVKKALNPIIKMESLEEVDLLESEGKKKSIDDQINNQKISEFRKNYLYKKGLKPEVAQLNRKLVIDFVAALSAMKENMKGPKPEEIREFVIELVQHENIQKEIFG